jgi:hypothetical protein
MPRLADIIHESIAAVEVAGRPISTHRAAKYGVAKILDDAELTYSAVLEWLTVKIQNAIKRSTRRAGLLDPNEYVMARREDGYGADAITIVPRQTDMFTDPFGLNDGHKLEGGSGEMHRTQNATLYDFEAFIRIRDKAIAADIKYRNRLTRTLERLRPVWEVDPMMTYEEACAIYVRQYGLPPKDDDESED